MKTPRITLQDMIKITGWIQARKDTLLQMSQSEVCRQIERDLGVKINQQRIGQFEQAAGVHRVRGNGTGARKDRVVVMAGELVRLMQQLGVTPSDDLVDISKGK